MRPYKTVETLVIDPYQFVPDFQRLPVEPFVEPLPNLLYLGGGFLYGFLVRHTHLVAVAINLFRYLRHGIVQGMDEQVFTVVIPHGIGVVRRRRIAFQPHKVGVVHIEIHHLGFHAEQLRRKIGVYLCVNPPLAHVDVKLLVRYRFGYGFLQRPHGCLRPFLFGVA